MKSSSHSRGGSPRLDRRHGAALIVTLGAVVLVTALVLAFFSRAQVNRRLSFSSTNQVKADMLARSALDIISGEIRDELVQGSDSTVIDGVTLYTPKTAANAVVQKTGVTGADTTVGKYTIAKVGASLGKVNPSATGRILGSSIPIDQLSANGRSQIGWFTRGPLLGTATLPTWSYLSRRHSIVSSPTVADAASPASDDYLIGRFAYTVYDVGGLLDANHAGYAAGDPLFSSATAKANAARKGAESYADLTAVGLSATQMLDLAHWRNTTNGSGVDAATFDEWAAGIPRPGGPPTDLPLLLAWGGHLQNSSFDNTFFSRRDLLRYAAAKGLPAGATGAAANFTHFSRAVPAPSWKPANLTAPPVPYGDNSDTASTINRNLPGVRWKNDTTIKEYADDGSFVNVAVKKGDPLVRRRFSLARLAWLTHNGPAAGVSASAILDCFGLTWNAGSKRWDYAHGATDRIYKLDDVRGAERPPDLFELLKAGILNGSLGKGPGAVAIGEFIESTPQRNIEGVLGMDFGDPEPGYSNVADMHVLAIGANIIDQADTDNYPTAIYLGFTPPHNYLERELYQTVFGIENLPYLQRMGNVTAVTVGPPGAPIQIASSWLQPELWNPHQNPYASYPPADTPAQLRLITLGECYMMNMGGATQEVAGENPGAPVIFGYDVNAPVDGGILTFPNKVDYFKNPVMITTDSVPGATSPSTKNLASSYAGTPVSFSSNKFVAVWTGDVKRATPPAATAFRLRIEPDSYLTFVLQYNDGAGWRSYSTMSRISMFGTQSLSQANTNGNAGWKEFMGHLDPRTDRFSASEGEAQGGGAVWATNKTARSEPGSANHYQTFFAFPRRSSGFTYTPLPVVTSPTQAIWSDHWARNIVTTTTQSAYYADPDGVTRPGDSGRVANFDDPPTSDGMMLYHLDKPTGVPAATAQGRRPTLLNRPFRSVGELGYVFRDMPFKTLDVSSDKSADAALLDLFSVANEPLLVAGQIDPRNAPAPVLKALISGARQNEASTVDMSSANADEVAVEWAAQISTMGLKTRADLTPALGAAINAKLGAIVDLTNKGYGEAPMRALAPITNTRTWNLLIDVVAQAGRLVPAAKNLGDFEVQGERRYWLHVAIDRVTGKVVDQQLEPVYE